MQIVTIHGNSDSPSSFESAFSSKYSVQNLRIPGHAGHTSDEPEKDYSVRQIKSRLPQEIQTSEPFLLVGHSLGGHLAIDIAPTLQHCVGLVIFGTPPIKKPLNINDAFNASESLGIYTRAEYTEEELNRVLDELCFNKDIIPQVRTNFKYTDPNFRTYYAQSAIGNGEFDDQVRIVEDLKIPIFVIHGKHDLIPNLDYIRQLKGITKIYEIEGAGHYPHLEQPEQFAKLVDEILEEIK